jgi:hypothetical protein
LFSARYLILISGCLILQPLFLEERVLASVNLWMNSAQARSSTHYDPHHNLLCLVAGCKQGRVLFNNIARSFGFFNIIASKALKIDALVSWLYQCFIF